MDLLFRLFGVLAANAAMAWYPAASAGGLMVSAAAFSITECEEDRQ